MPATMTTFEREVADMRRWFESPRFAGMRRPYSAREVVEQRGRIRSEYRVARDAAEAFHAHLQQLFADKKCITTYGPYSPGQAVAMKRAGIEGIYLGGWATSAKGSSDEDPGPDLASYPLSRVPDEAASVVRALLTADRNQFHTRARMTEEQRRATPEVDYRPLFDAIDLGVQPARDPCAVVDLDDDAHAWRVGGDGHHASFDEVHDLIPVAFHVGEHRVGFIGQPARTDETYRLGDRSTD